MVEAVFERSYTVSSRVASVHAAKIVALHALPNDYIQDLTQEALLELWLTAPAFDDRRAGWRTFSERVVSNRLASLLRHMHSSRSGHGKEDPLDVLKLSHPTSSPNLDLQTDVRRVLDGLSPFDRTVAQCLIDYSAIEASERLRVSRATVYRSIGRLRAAFTIAGFVGAGDGRKQLSSHRREVRA